jgi:phosphate/sulfate permease
VAWIFSTWVLSPIMGGVLGFLRFNLLRKRIFYARCPAKATEKLAPYIAFTFTTIIFPIYMVKKSQSPFPSR